MHSQPWYQMVSFIAMATLTHGRGSGNQGKMDGCAPEQVQTMWRTGKSFPMPGIAPQLLVWYVVWAISIQYFYTFCYNLIRLHNPTGGC
jgi:hypothetical protein